MARENLNSVGIRREELESMPEADETPSDLEFRRSLEGLRGVRGARVEVQRSDLTAIRVLVVPERDTTQTVNDVRALMFEKHGLEVDPAVIEVLRVAEPVENTGARRRKLSGITIERSGQHFQARVVLELGGDVLVGESDAPTERGFEGRSVARATLHGLEELLDYDVQLETVQILTTGNERLAVVTLARGAEILLGSALVRLDEHDAIARATLDAVNRRIGAPDDRPQLIRLAD